MSSGISPDLITIFMLVIITVLILIGIVLNKAHANRQANCLESIEMHLDVLEEDIICTDYSESTGEDFIGTSEENEYNRKDSLVQNEMMHEDSIVKNYNVGRNGHIYSKEELEEQIRV